VISTVVSDLGGVLTTPLADAFAAYEREAGVPLSEFWTALGEIAARTGANPMFELETARLSEREFTDALSAQLSDQLGRPIEVGDFSARWFAHLHANEAMLALMRSLARRGYRMGLLTNNVREWEPLWRPRLGIDAIFSVIVDSGFVGMRKPDPAIYALTEERLGVPAGEILFVDDVEANVEAARAAGWSAIRFDDNAQAIPEIEARLEAAGRPDPEGQFSDPSRSQQ
jgi:putative hydrolase of the HAD superfamily